MANFGGESWQEEHALPMARHAQNGTLEPSVPSDLIPLSLDLLCHRGGTLGKYQECP